MWSIYLPIYLSVYNPTSLIRSSILLTMILLWSASTSNDLIRVGYSLLSEDVVTLVTFRYNVKEHIGLPSFDSRLFTVFILRTDSIANVSISEGLSVEVQRGLHSAIQPSCPWNSYKSYRPIRLKHTRAEVMQIFRLQYVNLTWHVLF